MAYERRTHSRAPVNWAAGLTFAEGPSLPATVVDVSAGGACVEVSASAEPQRLEVVEMRARRSYLWGLVPRRPISVAARVVHVGPSQADGYVRVGIRFHAPLRRPACPSWLAGPSLGWRLLALPSL